MTKKEFIILKQYAEAMVETTYNRCCTNYKGKKYGLINIDDLNVFLGRVAVLVDEEEDS